MEPSNRSTLLGLPLEIRERIYEFIIRPWKEKRTSFGKPYITSLQSKKRNEKWRLFRVNKQIRCEAMAHHYRLIAVEICLDVRECSEKEALLIRDWLKSFRNNVACLRHLVLKAVVLTELGRGRRHYSDFDEVYRFDDDEEEVEELWEYLCHVDLARPSVKPVNDHHNRIYMSKDKKLHLSQNTRKAVSIVTSKRRRGKLSRKSLGLLFDAYYFACNDGIDGFPFGEGFDPFVPITPELEENTSLLDEFLASVPKKRKRN
jgi:hypothetical protein